MTPNVNVKKRKNKTKTKQKRGGKAQLKKHVDTASDFTSFV